MFRNNSFAGLAADLESIDACSLTTVKSRFRIADLRRLELPEPLDGGEVQAEASRQTEEEQAVEVFGFEEESVSAASSVGGGAAEPSGSEGEEELVFEELSDFEKFEEEPVEEDELDLVDEADHPDSNDQVLHNYLISHLPGRKTRVGLNIRSGVTRFHFLSDADYSSLKRKEVLEAVQKELGNAYGSAPDPNLYRYEIDEAQRLCIASLDREPESLRLLNRVVQRSGNRKVEIREILPDEMALAGLYRLNYPSDRGKNKITALIQFRQNRSRILLFRGHRIIHLSPIIQEGNSSRHVFETVFSKLLFQLDTENVPGVDRILLCDNRLGESTVEFFRSRFPDAIVDEFRLDPTRFELSATLRKRVPEFTTSIALAVAATGKTTDIYPALSIVPTYVIDRQKVFKLQWHGVLLLIAIGLSPALLNHYHQDSRAEIRELTLEESRLESLITDLQETVDQTVAMESQLGELQSQLALLYELSEGSVRWTADLDHIHEAGASIGGLWITNLRQSGDELLIEGVSLTQGRIPMLARRFGEVTLVQVRTDGMRDRPVYRFSMRIAQVVEDERLHTPETTRRIPEFLESFNEF